MRRARSSDGIARGFVTIDTVVACSSLFPPVFPSSPAYFAGLADTRNLFAGDFILADLGNNFAQGDALVAIQADPPSATPLFASGDYTFYGRFVSGDAGDRREPLATQWAVPYQDKPAHTLTTDLIVWRDPIEAVAPFACGGGLPAPFPLSTAQLIGFDMAENPEALSSMPPPFPVVAMRTSINGAAPSLAVSPRAGWLFLDLNSPADVAASPFTDKAARQSWIMVIRHGEGRFSSAHAAIQMDSAFSPPPPPTEPPPTETETPDPPATATATTAPPAVPTPMAVPAPAPSATPVGLPPGGGGPGGGGRPGPLPDETPGGLGGPL
jgi:hypothetical protein